MSKLDSAASIIFIGRDAVGEQDIADAGMAMIADIGDIWCGSNCRRRAWNILCGCSDHAGVLLSLEWMISCPMGQ